MDGDKSNPTFSVRLLTKILSILLFLPTLMGASGCPNALSGMADTTSDDAIFYQARMSIDSKDYSGALTQLSAASATGLASHQGHVLKATAYAGRCGLDMVALAFNISKATSTLFTQLLIDFQDVSSSSTRPADCSSAESELLAVSSSDRTTDDWVFLTFVELAKMGTILAKDADTNDDGTVDGSFNSCTTISDADTRQIGTGLVIALMGLSQSGIPLPGTVSANLTGMCTAIATATGDTSLCQTTDPAAFSAADVYAFRAMIKANEIGFGTCGGSTGSSSACMCP